jgi:hypothetical protein
MTQKVLDRKGRFRNKIISFRASPEEATMLDRKVRLAGVSKQDYLINCILDKEIIVEPNPYVITSIKKEIHRTIEIEDDLEIREWMEKMLLAFNGKEKTKIKPIEDPRQ